MVVARIGTLPVLLVVTCRPEFEAPWQKERNTTRVMLERLGMEHSAALATAVVGGRNLPPMLVREIVARGDGVPLFIEELVKTVVEARRSRGNSGASLPPDAIPTTLRDSLLARLERLNPEKHVLQVGAVIGRDFPLGLLAAVVPLREHELLTALDRLAGTALISRREAPSGTSYAFKHTLVREAAYRTLLRRERRELHARIAQVLEKRFGELTAAEPERLAQHYEAAGLAEPAVRYWLAAGQRAHQRSANAEAVIHLRQGIGLLDSLPEGPSRAELELGLQASLGLVLNATRGYAHPEVEQAYARAHQLCQQLGDEPAILPVLFGLIAFHITRSELGRAREVAEQVLRLAETTEDSGHLLVAHVALGVLFWYMGKNHDAHEHIYVGLNLYVASRNVEMIAIYGHDMHVAALSFLSVVQANIGRHTSSIRLAGEAIAAACDAGHPFSLCFALTHTNFYLKIFGEFELVLQQAEKCLAIAEEQGFGHWRATSLCYRGWVITCGHSAVEGIQQIREGVAYTRATGSRMVLAGMLSYLAEACAHAGLGQEALAAADEALASLDYAENHHGPTKILVQCARGDALLALRRPNVLMAEVEYDQALVAARNQGALTLELYAAVRLARMWRCQRRDGDAQALLEPLHGRFTESHGTNLLLNAKALLGGPSPAVVENP